VRSGEERAGESIMQVDGSGTLSAGGMGLGATAGNSELGREEFLRLLIEQLKHQDPMEPMENSQFVAQLAQFSNLEQLVSVNEGINLLGLQQMGQSNAQAAGFLGKVVEVRSDKLDVGSDDMSADAAFRLTSDAASVEVKFRDQRGEVVRTMQLGPKEEGMVEISWDILNDNGVKVPPGSYRMDVVALDADDQPVGYEAHAKGEVTGVSYAAGYPELVMGSIRAAVSDVLGVFPSEEESP